MIAFIQAHAALLVACVYLACNLANALLPYDKTNKITHAILDFVTVLTRKDSPGTVKLFGTFSKMPTTTEAPK